MFYRENLVRNVTKDEIKKKIMEDPDFIKNPRFGNSLSKFLARNNEEINDRIIARFLMISEKEVSEIFEKSVDVLKSKVEESKNED